METKTKKLKKTLLIWYKKNKRTFSWRETKDPWKILLTEILSQQTQIERADTYYKKFIKEFPSTTSMSNSSLKKVLTIWSGLGYNNRARRLHESSKILAENLCRRYYDAEKLPVSILRFSMVFGRFEVCKWSQFYTGHFLETYREDLYVSKKCPV